MTTNYEFDLQNQSNYTLSFIVDFGTTYWIANGKKQKPEELNKQLKNELPSDKTFNITSLIFNIESKKEEVLTKYSCVYKKETDSLCFLIEDSARYADFSKEIMINLMEFAQKLGIKIMFLFISRGNKEYVKILQGMLTVGFQQEEKMSTAKIDGKNYRVLKMNMKQDDEIEEIDF